MRFYWLIWAIVVIEKEIFMKKYSDIIKMLIPPKQIIRGLKNASYLGIGHFLSMAISFVGFIFVARLLGPNDYGIYATVGAFVGMFDIITVYGINKVVLREGAKDLSQMSNYLEKTTGIKNLFTFIAIVVCIISSFFTPYSMQVKLYIILFSFSLIYKSFSGFLSTVYKAAEKMQYNAILTILNNVMFVSLSIAFLYMGFGLLALFIIALLSHFFNLIINYQLTKRILVFKFWNKIKWDKYILKSAIIFSILSFTYMLAGRIDLIMISIMGSSKDVGIYGVAFQIISVGLVTRTLLATAFFPIFVKAYNKNPVKWIKLLKYSSIMGIGLLSIASIISLYSEQIIPLIFGGIYFESGTVLSVLVFVVAISYFNIPFLNTLQATHNEIELLKISWIAPSLNIVLNIIFFKWFGLVGIAYATLVVGCVYLSLYILTTWRTLKKQNLLV